MANDQRDDGALSALADLIERFAAPGGRPITLNIELYYDLGLAGDDLYELFEQVYNRFRTDFSSMRLGDYAPGETETLFSLDPLRELLGRPRRYRSLTLRLLHEAVEAGVWKDG